MTSKCKKGYKVKKGKCIPDPWYLGITKADKGNIKHIFSKVVLTVSAWGVFWAVINLTGLKDTNYWILLVISLIVGIISFRIGVKD